MSGESTSFLVGACLLVVLGWLAACAEAGISRISRFRAEEAVRAGRRGSGRLLTLASDPIRYLNLATLIRVASEMAAAVLVTLVCVRSLHQTWQAVLLAFGVMVLVQPMMLWSDQLMLCAQFEGSPNSRACPNPELPSCE